MRGWIIAVNTKKGCIPHNRSNNIRVIPGTVIPLPENDNAIIRPVFYLSM
jgi:hypothetical protein